MEDKPYNSPSPSSSNSTYFGFLSIVFVFVGLTAIYFLYRFLYTPVNSTAVVITGGQQAANSIADRFPNVPTPHEGGEYSMNTWVYINSYNMNLNTRKHLFELRGTYFSTLLVGFGAFKNSLFVRTQTDSVEGFQNRPSRLMSNALAKLLPGMMKSSKLSLENFVDSAEERSEEIRRQLEDGVYDLDGGDGEDGEDGEDGYDGDDVDDTAETTEPPGVFPVGNLSADTVDAMFKPLAMDDSLLDTPPICDLTEVDLQRWTMISVVLNGRTIDVYIDGKLSRSCVASSYYKVDPTGVKPIMTDYGGFDGYTGTTSLANYAMNPDEIYRAYLAGPQAGNNSDVFAWFISLFKGSS